MDTVRSRPAYAKVNLHLAVGLPYPDGYHPIQSLFALVDLYDSISLTYEESRTFSIEVEGLEAYCSAGNDTLTKAARLWHEAGGCPMHLRVRCQKRIPVQAGLGGGSSDAATLLLMLQQLVPGRALTQKQLLDVGLQVGSDVPFFLSCNQCALVTGRGEVVTPIEPRHLSIVLVMPSFFAISTSSAYRALDMARQTQEPLKQPGIQTLLQVYKNPTSEWNGLLYNDFQAHSGFSSFYQELESFCVGYSGFASMSGSGACWFFVSEDAQAVSLVHAAIRRAFGERVSCFLTQLMQ